MSLIAWYPLNGDMNNYGIGDVDLTIYDTPSFSNNGKICKSLCGGGSATLTSNQISKIFNDNNVSIAFWIKPLDDTVGESNIIFGNDSPRRFSIFQYPTGNDLHWDWRNSENTIVSSGMHKGILPTNTWTHLAFIYEKPQVKFYLNGVLWEVDNNVNIDFPSFDDTRILYSNTHRCINDLRLYDHALSKKEINELYKCKVLHYPMNEMDGVIGGRNYILASNIVTSGSDGPGITSSYESDGSLKIIATAGNGNYRSIKFAESSNTSITNNFVVGETYTVSFDIKIQSGSGIPKLFINGGNGYDTMIGSPNLLGVWQTVYKIRTWADPGTSYGSISLHLGFSNLEGTYYIKNFKIQKGAITTPIWTPAPEDGAVCANDNTIYDVSGYGNHGIVTTTSCPTWSNESIIGNGSYSFSGSHYIASIPSSQLPKDDITVSWWGYMDNWGNYTRAISCTENGGWNFEPNGGKMSFPIYSGGNYKIAISPTALNSLSSGWHMFTGTYDGMTVKLYIDGKLDASINAYSTKTTISYNSNNALFIGGEAGNDLISPVSSYFNGKMNDVRIYATALPEENIKELYQTRYSVDYKGSLFCNEVIETVENMMSSSNDSLIEGKYTNGIDAYTQTNCISSFVDNKLHIYRPPNYDGRSIGEGGNYNTWGGLRINNQNNKLGLQNNHSYLLLFHVEGKSSNGIQSFYWTNTMGWGGGETAPNPTNRKIIGSIPDNFQGEVTMGYQWTISDTVYKQCTSSYQNFVAGNSYVAYNHFACGWGYTKTGDMGTDIYFSNFRLYDITDMDDISVQMLSEGNLSAMSIAEVSGKFRIGDGFIKANNIYEI